MATYNVNSGNALNFSAYLVSNDIIIIDSLCHLIVQEYDSVKLVLKITSMSNKDGEVMNNSMVKFVARLLDATGGAMASDPLNGRLLYVIDEDNNKMLMKRMDTGDKVNADGEFLGTNVECVSSTSKLIVGMLSYAGDLVRSRDIDMGFYLKGISSSFVINHFPTVVLNVKTDKVSSTKEFSDKLITLMDSSIIYFSRPDNFIVSKNANGSFNLILVNTGSFMLLDPTKPVEYAINQLSHATHLSNRNEQRAARQLYNNSLAPAKGRYNGWALDTKAVGINWNLYNADKDQALSGAIQYLWAQIYIPNNNAQSVNFVIDGVNHVMSTPASAPGRHVIWMSPTLDEPPSKNQFNLIADTEDIVEDVSGVCSNSMLTWNLQAGSSDAFYLEAFGYQDQVKAFNLATRQMFDFRIPEENQVYLSNQQGYDMMQRRFIERFIDADGSYYPMDRYSEDASGNSTNAQIEEKARGSQGWYFDNSKTEMDLKLIQQLDVSYNDLHTLFVEVIVKDAGAVVLSAYGQTSTFNLLEGHQIISINKSPLSSEGLADATLGPHFPALNNCLLVTNQNIASPGSDGPVLLNVSTDVEVISFGYKQKTKLPVHWACRWESTEVNPMSRVINDYLQITKDVQIDLEQPEEVNDAMFAVRAYGNFVEGSYSQYGNNYNNIKVDVRLNKPAVENAYYVLDSCSLNNYTIDPTGLRYKADAVAMVDKAGDVVYKLNNNVNELDGVLVNNKYIMADFQNSDGIAVNNINAATFFTTQDTTNIFSKEGGLAPVVLQSIYAALFKQFNKSASIINNSLCSTIQSTVYTQCDKPVPAVAVLSATNSTVGCFQQSATYRYKLTFAKYTAATPAVLLETEGSDASNAVTQANSGSPKKVTLTLPTTYSGALAPTKVRIYREKNMSGDYRFVAEVLLAAGTYTDDISDSSISALAQVPNVNTLISQESTGTKLSESLESKVEETAVDSESSILFKLYQACGRLEKDHAVYGVDKRSGKGFRRLADETLANPDPSAPDTISMNLENMELKFKIKLRGSIFDNGTGNLTFAKEALNKQLAEIVFGKYNNGSLEPQTLVRLVTRTSNAATDNGVDELGHIMTMLTSGNQEIQYEIIFKIVLIQKSVNA